MTGFPDFWAEYPRKAGKADAEIFYRAALKGKLRRQVKLDRKPATHKEIMAGLERYKKSKPDYADWQHGSTFLSKLTWEDEGSSDVVEPTRDKSRALEVMRQDHESGWMMYPTMAEQHGWAEYGSKAPKLRVVK